MIILLLTAVTLPLILLFSFFLNQAKLQKSLQPPGPPGLPFIGNLHQFYTTNSTAAAAAAAPHIHLWQLSNKYGPLMSLKLGKVPVVVISSPRIAKEVLKTHDLVFSSRPRFLALKKLSYDFLDVAFTPYSESWREMRKICVIHLLSNKRVQSFRPIREDEVFRMIRNLSVKANTSEVTDLSRLIMSLTSSLICRVAFGKRFDEEENKRWRFDQLMIESQAMQGGFFVSDYLPSFGWIDRISGMIGRLQKSFRDFDEFYQELIDDHLDPNRTKAVNPDILDLLIQLKGEKSCSVDMTWDHIKAVVMNILIAGTDTSAATITWAMTALMKNSNAMKKLQREIRELGGGRDGVYEDDLPKFSYLKAVIKETMRLYPPAPLLLPKETLESCMINGYIIPPKTLVHINAWAIARDPEYWESPNEFIPERFLDTSVDIIGQDFEVIPFGSGRRGCPGISMGLVTVELALANLLYSFDWELPSGVRKEDIDTEVLPGLTMHKKNPLLIVPKIYKYN